MSTSELSSAQSSQRLSWLPFGLLLLVFAPVILGLVNNWMTDDNYSHGFLIPIVSGYLLWSRRKELATFSLNPDTRGFLLLGFGLIIFILGTAMAEYFSVRVAFVFALSGLVLTVFGLTFWKNTWFEIAFLFFMIPLPYVLYYAATFPMQVLATQITVFILKTAGMSLVQQGNMIHIAGYSLEVAEACSGMRSITAMLALGALFAHLSHKKMLPKILLFTSTVPLAIAGNVVRVFFTTVLVAVGVPEIIAEPWHSIMGLLVFLFVLVGLLIVNFLLKRIWP